MAIAPPGRSPVGQPPRVRRSHLREGAPRDRDGSTSARAEEPITVPRRTGPCRVNLRACGGAVVVALRDGAAVGFNLRACGGACKEAATEVAEWGQPPRVRRSRRAAPAGDMRAGLTSARAEEPSSEGGGRGVEASAAARCSCRWCIRRAIWPRSTSSRCSSTSRDAHGKAWMFVMRLMHSGRDFAWLYLRQDQTSFLDGHVRAFAHFGCVPQSHRVRQPQGGGGRSISSAPSGCSRAASRRCRRTTCSRRVLPAADGPRQGRRRVARQGDSLAAPRADSSRRRYARRDPSDATGAAGRERRRGAPRRRARAESAPCRHAPSTRARTHASVSVSRRALVCIEGAMYSVPCDVGGARRSRRTSAADVVTLVGPERRRCIHARSRFGEQVDRLPTLHPGAREEAASGASGRREVDRDLGPRVRGRLARARRRARAASRLRASSRRCSRHVEDARRRCRRHRARCRADQERADPILALAPVAGSQVTSSIASRCPWLFAMSKSSPAAPPTTTSCSTRGAS